MSEPSNVEFYTFISDIRAAIDKHAEDCGRVINRMNKPADEISAPTESDNLWACIVAFHTALVDWVIAEDIRPDKIKAAVLIDVGLRMFLDNTRDIILAAEAEKQKPKKSVIHLQN